MNLVKNNRRSRGIDSLFPIGQGVFYLATGIWPLVNIQSFEMVTGPKTDSSARKR